jgi:hypothetical protein
MTTQHIKGIAAKLYVSALNGINGLMIFCKTLGSVVTSDREEAVTDLPPDKQQALDAVLGSRRKVFPSTRVSKNST